MSTVIDSLIVELGLDPKKFTQGQQEALNKMKQFGEDAERRARGVEDSSKGIGETLASVRSQALGLFSVLAGGSAVTAFAANAVKTGADVGRMSRNIGISASVISRWQGVAKVFGGTAEGMASSFKTVSDAFAGWKVGSVSPLIADFRAISSAGGKTIDMNKGVEQSFFDLADNLKAIHDRDPAQAGFWQSRLGLDPALFDALIEGSDKFSKNLARMKALTDENAAAATNLDRRWNEFTANALTGSKKAFFGLIDKLKNAWVTPGAENSENTPDLPVKPSSAALTSPTAMKSYADSIANIESRGSGGYSAIGPPTRNGDRAYGRYQVMGNNIGDWSEAALGKRLSIDEFMASKEAQDTVFNHKFGQLTNKFGNPQDAASAWLTGQPLSRGANRRDVNGTTGMEYVRRFNAGLPSPGATASLMSNGGGGSGNGGTTINVSGPISINAGPNADGTKIAQDFRSELQRRQSSAAQSNNGQN